MYLWSMRSPGDGELSLSACPGVGNTPPSEKKMQIPGDMPGEEMVTGRVEPCINMNSARSRENMKEQESPMGILTGLSDPPHP